MLGVAQGSPNTFATFQSSFTYFSQYAQRFSWPYVKQIKRLQHTSMVKKTKNEPDPPSTEISYKYSNRILSWELFFTL